ncbi:MAG: ABC transporter ATP-binding protein [Fimbriimonadaceae bacterium]|nr:ABC transporter ATP-binding protein [Fimbriimonadaceae bacterium]
MVWRLFRLDRRLVDDLLAQKRSLSLGLACVIGTSILTAATIPLTEWAIRSIGNAAPIAVDTITPKVGDQDLARELGIPVERAREALSRIENASAPEAKLAKTRRQDSAIRELGYACLLVVLIFGVKYFLTRGQAFYLGRAGARLASDLRIRLFSKLQRLPMRYFNEKRVGAIQSALSNDVVLYQNAVNMIRDGLDGPIKAVLALGAIFFIKWQLALVALFFVPILAILVHRNGQRMKAAQSDVQEDLSTLTAMTNEALGGTRVVKAFAAEDRIKDIYSGLVERTFGSQMKATRRFAQLRPMVEFMGAVSLAIILYFCGWLARWGDLQISQILAMTLALDVINQGARAMANMNNTYNQVQAASDRLHREVLDVDPEQLESGAKTLPSTVGQIEFRDVSFTYPDGTVALDRISFTIEPGTSLALVGPSGAGKSTIADLILRFYDPTDGQILLDGVDIRELDLTWLRRQYGVVPQQTFLFAGTIADNIRLGLPDADDHQMRTAADASHVDAFVERMPDGYETELGERGVRLSGGEMQRLAIARAILRDPKVLLMDEATSNLDAVSEKLVTDALEKFMPGRTTLFIAHRLTTASRATRIAVLRRGEIVEIGTHEELMARGLIYAGMYKAFLSGVLGEELG